MKARLVALALLAALGFGLTAGPHPCRAAEPPAMPTAASGMAMPACHAAGPPAEAAGLTGGGPGCCEEESPGAGLLCERACHAPGLCVAGPALAAIRVASGLAPAPAPSGAVLFVPAIDHIPLA